MKTVFVSGSMKIKKLDPLFKQRLSNLASSGLNIVVGDADGADTSIQSVLRDLHATNVSVYCSGSIPRNNVGDWPIEKIFSPSKPGTRAFFTAKDIEMARIADFGLMIWDARSAGTLSNIIELLNRNKTSVVFVNKDRNFINVHDVNSFMSLVSRMSDAARLKVDKKIRLSSQIKRMSDNQLSLPI